MNQRIAELLDDVAVEFGVFAFQHEVDFFSLLDGQIPYQSGHLLECVANGNHSQRHRRALEVGCDATKLAQAAR